MDWFLRTPVLPVEVSRKSFVSYVIPMATAAKNTTMFYSKCVLLLWGKALMHIYKSVSIRAIEDGRVQFLVNLEPF